MTNPTDNTPQDTERDSGDKTPIIVMFYGTADETTNIQFPVYPTPQAEIEAVKRFLQSL